MPAAAKEEVLNIPVIGMSCAACQNHVEKTLRKTPGVSAAAVSLMAHSARIVFDRSIISPEGLVHAVKSAGYDAALPEEKILTASGDEEAKAERLRVRAFAILIFAAVSMLLSMPLMHSMGPGGRLAMKVAPWLFELPATALRFLLFALALCAMIWAGREIYIAAWRAALHRATNMNTLVALGTGAAFLYSAVATFVPSLFLRHGFRAEVYYESVLFILAFLLLGRWLEARAKTRTQDALRAFAALQPAVARVLQSDGAEEEIPLALVQSGDRIVLRPGERVPVDGIVESGCSSVDESHITGESLPVARGKGDRLIGGSLNYDGALEYRATSLGADGVLGQMLRMMQEAQSSRAPTQQFADKVSGIFVPIVLALAALTFAAWMLAHQALGVAFAISIAVLVIACPCAMGLAVPAALTVAIGRAAQLGILFKNGEAIERVAGVDTIVFDKTGTLTMGRPAIVQIAPALDIPEARLLQLTASLESLSEHPLAKATVAAAEERGIQLLAVSDLRVRPGMGVSGMVDGHLLAAGNAALMKELGVSHPEQGGDASVLFVVVDGKYSGHLLAQDVVRPGVQEVVTQLERMGMPVIMLTGDSEAAANAVAKMTGVQRVFAGLLPAQKLERIRELQANGRRVLMVGDGINDAAALAQADAGFAIGTGTDLAREAGDGILLRGETRSVLDGVMLARRTLQTMRANLGWALVYNVIGIPIAAGVLYPLFGLLLSPALASAAMALSSVSVLANSLRLRRFQPQ